MNKTKAKPIGIILLAAVIIAAVLFIWPKSSGDVGITFTADTVTAFGTDVTASLDLNEVNALLSDMKFSRTLDDPVYDSAQSVVLTGNSADGTAATVVLGDSSCYLSGETCYRVRGGADLYVAILELLPVEVQEDLGVR